MKSKLFTIKGHLRPYLSLAIPNKIAPTDLNMRTKVIPHVMDVADLLNVSLSSSTVSETEKKSKESQDQAQNAH